jgi:hypothetical protein
MDAQGIAFGTQNRPLAKLAPMHRDIVNVPGRQTWMRWHGTGLVSGFGNPAMSVKTSRRLPPAPHARLSNWTIAALAAAVGALALVARNLA